MSDLKVAVSSAGGGKVAISLAGRLVPQTVDSFNEQMHSLPDGASEVSIDLAGISQISSAGIGALASRTHEMLHKGLKVHLQKPSEQVARLLHYANLDQLLDAEE